MKALTKHTQETSETNISELIYSTAEMIKQFDFNQLNEIASSIEKIKNYMECMRSQNERSNMSMLDSYAPVNSATFPEVPGDNRILHFSGKY